MKTIQANVNLGIQFSELKIGGEIVKVSLMPKTDVFRSEDESSKDEKFTSKTRETEVENSTKDLEN